MKTKPNVLFLFSDQHNARCMSCANHPDVHTPNLDRLSKEGVRFGHAYANNPICTPSRVSFLSGTYPSTHGYYGLYGRQPQGDTTSIFRHFQEHGYRTGALGKLHTPRFWIERHCQFIYDEFVEYPKYLEGAGLYEKNDNRPFTGNRDGERSEIPEQHSCESALLQQALRFIDNEGEPKDRGPADAPWFGWVSFSRPHQPYTPSEPFASMYDPNDISLPPIDDMEKETVIGNRKNLTSAELRKLLAAYYGVISQIDDSIGKLLQALEDRGELDNTVIVYASDHGDYAGEHGLMEKVGGISYSAICRIPFIVRLPEQAQRGVVLDEIIESVDLFPTLCELSGLPVANTIQGKSFAQVIAGKESSIRKDAFTENPYRKALATKQFRYVANLRDEESDELYDLSSDPWELVNRIDDPAYRDVCYDMQRRLLDRTVKVRRPVTTNNGSWHDHVYDQDGRIDLSRCGPLTAYW